jgi:2-oxo-4-hydroxy-4-carboxy-5-ureidoimidazoline decarboxylase
MKARPTLAALSAAPRDEFVRVLGGIFEHTPWIAERAYAARPFATVDDLHRAMVAALAAASREAKLALIRAHPELAGKEAAAGTMTADSAGEQASAGLDRCTPEELARLRSGNHAYRDKFGFPFVMAVKGKSRQEILTALASRVGGTRDAEFARCIEEIGKIARLRLDALFASHPPAKDTDLERRGEMPWPR